MYNRTAASYIPYYYAPAYEIQPYFPYYNAPVPRQTYPNVDATLFNQSAIAMQKLIREASIILDKLADSKTFAHSLMSAAQESKTKEVEHLIKSTGIKSKVDTSYNPDGINLKLSSKTGGTDCCKLTIGLRWS